MWKKREKKMMSKECSVTVTKINTPQQQIPLDLMHDILSRLPVKSLVRFKCLSKRCRSEIIEDPSFIKLHQKRSPQTNTGTGTSIIFRNWEGEFLLVDPDSLEQETRKAIKLNLPWNTNPLTCKETIVVGSCKGLLCLANRENHQHLVGSQIFVLWNFSTGKFKFLPFKPAPFKLGRHCFYGFGYDAVHDDYKVVMITQYEYKDDSLEVMVYSLRRNEWTSISKPISQYCFDRFNLFSQTGVLVNDGVLYWMAKKYGMHRVWDCKIFAFDLTALEFRDEAYICFCHPNLGWLDLEVLEGRLCVCETRYFDGTRHFNIWELEEKWSRIVMQEYRQYLSSVVYSKNGCRLLLLKGDGAGELCWLDLDNMDELHHLKIPGLKNLEQANVCKGSLVPL